jgi:hypothetical protein
VLRPPETIEPADALLRRIDEASEYVSRDQLALSTQCGFASAAEGNLIGEATQEAKLRLVAEVAVAPGHSERARDLPPTTQAVVRLYPLPFVLEAPRLDDLVRDVPRRATLADPLAAPS